MKLSARSILRRVVFGVRGPTDDELNALVKDLMEGVSPELAPGAAVVMPIVAILWIIVEFSSSILLRILEVLALLPWIVFALERRHGLLADLGAWSYIMAGILFVLNLGALLVFPLYDAARWRMPFGTERRQLWRGVVGILAPIVGIVGCYSTVYYRAALHSTTCFSTASVTHLDASYITVGNLSTIGSAGLTPGSQFCRALVLTQSAVEFVIITAVAAAIAFGLFGARAS
jgi:hypothetical protein